MLNGEHIPMVKYMLDYTMKASLEIAFGKEIKINKELRELRHTFDAVRVIFFLFKNVFFTL